MPLGHSNNESGASDFQLAIVSLALLWQTDNGINNYARAALAWLSSRPVSLVG